MKNILYRIRLIEKQIESLFFKIGSFSNGSGGSYTPLSHLTDFNNPHSVTKLQLGLDKVENIAESERIYTHSQTVLSGTWVVPHNLNKKCSVSITDEFNNKIVGAVTYTDNNQVIINFNSPKIGFVYCN